MVGFLYTRDSGLEIDRTEDRVRDGIFREVSDRRTCSNLLSGEHFMVEELLDLTLDFLLTKLAFRCCPSESLTFNVGCQLLYSDMWFLQNGATFQVVHARKNY